FHSVDVVARPQCTVVPQSRPELSCALVISPPPPGRPLLVCPVLFMNARVLLHSAYCSWRALFLFFDLPPVLQPTSWRVRQIFRQYSHSGPASGIRDDASLSRSNIAFIIKSESGTSRNLNHRCIIFRHLRSGSAGHLLYNYSSMSLAAGCVTKLLASHSLDARVWLLYRTCTISKQPTQYQDRDRFPWFIGKHSLHSTRNQWLDVRSWVEFPFCDHNEGNYFGTIYLSIYNQGSFSNDQSGKTGGIVPKDRSAASQSPLILSSFSSSSQILLRRFYDEARPISSISPIYLMTLSSGTTTKFFCPKCNFKAEGSAKSRQRLAHQPETMYPSEHHKIRSQL
ncbi:hypothetical protein C8R44DRAFT_910521, partial [Mycena epipterygia]